MDVGSLRYPVCRQNPSLIGIKPFLCKWAMKEFKVMERQSCYHCIKSPRDFAGKVISGEENETIEFNMAVLIRMVG